MADNVAYPPMPGKSQYINLSTGKHVTVAINANTINFSGLFIINGPYADTRGVYYGFAYGTSNTSYKHITPITAAASGITTALTNTGFTITNTSARNGSILVIYFESVENSVSFTVANNS